jgi:Rod binding domain-containing protein
MSGEALQLSSAVAAAKPQVPQLSAKGDKQAAKAAQDFEAVFLSEILSPMFEGLPTDGPFSGGPSEGIFRSMMVEQYSKSIAAQGGLGLADSVKRQLLQAQEAAP